MSKTNIQTTTRELKEKSKALLERIKAFQEQVTASFKEIRAAEASLAERLKEEKRLQAESAAADRMTAYIMPDEPEVPKAEPARAAVAERAQQARQPQRAERVPRQTAPQRDARPAAAKDGKAQQARPERGDRQARPQRPERAQQAARPARDGAAEAPRPRATSRPGGAAAHIPAVAAPPVRERAERTERAPEPPKKSYESERRGKSKKAAIKEAPPAILLDDERMGSRKRPKKQQQPVRKVDYPKIEHAIIPTETVTVKEFSEIIGKPVAEIIKKLFMLGIMATINNEIDFDTCELIAAEYGITLEHKVAKTQEEVLQESLDVEDEAH